MSISSGTKMTSLLFSLLPLWRVDCALSSGWFLVLMLMS